MKTSILIGLSRHRNGVDSVGVTTLVAFHGCPLRCKYCLTPQALSPEGVWKQFTPEELFKEVKKDDLYFRATGGGVTLKNPPKCFADPVFGETKNNCHGKDTANFWNNTKSCVHRVRILQRS